MYNFPSFPTYTKDKFDSGTKYAIYMPPYYVLSGHNFSFFPVKINTKCFAI